MEEGAVGDHFQGSGRIRNLLQQMKGTDNSSRVLEVGYQQGCPPSLQYGHAW